MTTFNCFSWNSGTVLSALVALARARGLACIAASLILTSAANAQPIPAPGSTPGAGVSILHAPIKSQELPYPGQPITLIAKLANTRSTAIRLRVATVVDGRSMDVVPGEPTLDEYDRPTYRAEISAPLAELIYQFVFISQDGKTLASPRYSLRRSCIPNVELAEIRINPELSGYARLQEVFNQSKRLEADIATLDRALDLLEKLQKEVRQ